MRRYTRFIAFSLAALILLVIPVAGIVFSATLHEDGKGYSALVIANNTERYDLIEPGMVGERIPLEVTNLSVFNETSALSVKPDRGILDLPEGNYTIRYDAPVTGNTIQFLFPEESNVTVLLPSPYRIGNPLLTSLQPAGYETLQENNTTTVSWKKARTVELRYYDETQEHLLFLFAQFWLIIAVVLLLPFFLSPRE